MSNLRTLTQIFDLMQGACFGPERPMAMPLNPEVGRRVYELEKRDGSEFLVESKNKSSVYFGKSHSLVKMHALDKGAFSRRIRLGRETPLYGAIGANQYGVSTSVFVLGVTHYTHRTIKEVSWSFFEVIRRDRIPDVFLAQIGLGFWDCSDKKEFYVIPLSKGTSNQPVEAMIAKQMLASAKYYYNPREHVVGFLEGRETPLRSFPHWYRDPSRRFDSELAQVLDEFQSAFGPYGLKIRPAILPAGQFEFPRVSVFRDGIHLGMVTLHGYSEEAGALDKERFAYDISVLAQAPNAWKNPGFDRPADYISELKR